MERRGSGLKKIINETEKLTGYTGEMKPEFYSTESSFRAVLKNVNYKPESATMQDAMQVTMQDTMQVTIQDDRFKKLVIFCSDARTREEMQSHINIGNRDYFRRAFLKPLLESGQLKMTIPDKPNSKNQRYIKA